MIKSRRWAGHVACIGGEVRCIGLLVGKPEGKSPLAKHRRRGKDDVKNGSWISWMATWNELMRRSVVQVAGFCEFGNGLSGSIKCLNFLTGWGTDGFWGRTVLHQFFSIMTGLRIGGIRKLGSFPGRGERILASPKPPHRLRRPPSPVFSRYRGTSLIRSWKPPCVVAKIAQSYTIMSPYAVTILEQALCCAYPC